MVSFRSAFTLLVQASTLLRFTSRAHNAIEGNEGIHLSHDHRFMEDSDALSSPTPEPVFDESVANDFGFGEASFQACGTVDMSDEEIFLAQELEAEFWESQNRGILQTVWDFVRSGLSGRRWGGQRRLQVGSSGGGGGGSNGNEMARVPTYYHIIQPSGGSSATPTDSRIDEQHRILNQAYAGLFTFDKVKVTRTTNDRWYGYTASGIGSTDIEMKNALREGGPESLNIYLNKGAGYCGYAYYPSALRNGLSRDGVVLNELCFPGSGSSTKLGDTLVHEVGHWLGLPHTFQNGCQYPGDGIDDTPYEAEPNRDCNAGSSVRDTCPNSPGFDPVNNYMDYSPDSCRREFSSGQRSRMTSEWRNYRA